MKKKPKNFRQRSIIAGQGKSSTNKRKELKAYEAEKKAGKGAWRAEKKTEKAKAREWRKSLGGRVWARYEAEQQSKIANATEHVPERIKKLGVDDLRKLRKNVKSSNLAWIDFEFKDWKQMKTKPDEIQNEKGTLTIGFKSGGVYEYLDCEFFQYCELLTGGKAGFFHHQGEHHSFKTQSRGHYFYYNIKDKYMTKKIR